MVEQLCSIVARGPAVAILLVANTALAQSVYDDGKGTTSLLVAPSVGVLGINTGDASIQISMLRLISTSSFMWGAHLSARPSDGIGPLLSDGKLSPGVRIGGFFGLKITGQNTLYLRLSAAKEQTTLYDRNQEFGSQISKKAFYPWDAGLDFVGSAKDVLVGAAAGVRHLNNYEDLRSVKVQDSLSTVDPATTTTRTRVAETNAHEGKYLEGIVGYLDFDAVVLVKEKVPLAAGVFGRFANGGADELRRETLGLTLNWIHDSAVDLRKVGLVVAVNDVFGRLDASKTYIDRLEISLVANLPLIGDWND